MSVILTIIIFSIIVVIHEWGHLRAAKACGVNVEEFAVGMGPKLCGTTIGGTLYSIRLLPLGGFCRMTDETDGDKVGFLDVSVWKRMIICVAGPLMNFVLAIAVMIIIGMMQSVSTTQIAEVVENSAAAEAGLKKDDIITAVNGKKTISATDVNLAILQNGGNTAELTVKRGSGKISVPITPKYDEERERYFIGVVMVAKGPMIDIGIYPKEELAKIPRANFAESVVSGCNDGIFTIKITLQSIAMLVTRDIPVSELSGPIGVTSVVGDTYQETKEEAGLAASILMLANITALLSANLGIMNLLPIPALDGGRLLIYIVEVIRRKRIPPEKEGMINLAGFALMMMLAIFVAFNDITRLIK